jgi:hypothetical protein
VHPLVDELGPSLDARARDALNRLATANVCFERIDEHYRHPRAHLKERLAVLSVLAGAVASDDPSHLLGLHQRIMEITR